MLWDIRVSEKIEVIWYSNMFQVLNSKFIYRHHGKVIVSRICVILEISYFFENQHSLLRNSSERGIKQKVIVKHLNQLKFIRYGWFALKKIINLSTLKLQHILVNWTLLLEWVVYLLQCIMLRFLIL